MILRFTAIADFFLALRLISPNLFYKYERPTASTLRILE